MLFGNSVASTPLSHLHTPLSHNIQIVASTPLSHRYTTSVTERSRSEPK